MRDADLWEDVGNFMVHSCGKRLGNMVSAAIEVASGETDLAAARIESGAETDQNARKRSFIVSRMVASEAVASEFIVTGSFLVVTVATYMLDNAGLTTLYQLLPTPAGKLAHGCDPCACDADGWVAGVNTGQTGGCIANRSAVLWPSLRNPTFEAELCLV